MDVIDLSTLILEVQASLSDLPDYYATDEQIYFDLKIAYAYVANVASSDWTDMDFAGHVIARLGAYLTYMNYTSLAEKKLGEVPTSMQIKIEAMRRIVIMMLRLMSNMKINDDLTIDDQSLLKAHTAGMVIMPTALYGNRY